MIYQFGDLQLDQGKRQLKRGDEIIKLPKLSFDVLNVLIESSPNHVSPDELIDKAWGERRVVSPENITQRIKILRKSLNDDASHPTYIDVLYGQGFRLIPAVTIVNENSHTKLISNKKNSRLQIASAITAIVVLVMLLKPLLFPENIDLLNSNSQFNPDSQQSAALPKIDLSKGPSIAVLPFVNMSDDNNEYFSDGISEEIINTLVRQTNLSIVSRTSSFQFKDKQVDGKLIGKVLNATHLLEGSVRRFGERLRITAQLIDSPTGTHLWSNQYDRSIENLFDVQEEIAASIVKEIKLQLISQGENRLPSFINYVPTSLHADISSQAYEAYLKGLMHRNRMLPDDIALAIEFFEQAVQLSPEFVEAWEILIETQLDASSFHFSVTTPVKAYNKIEQYLAIAQPLFPDNLYFSAVHGGMLAFNHYQWQQGLAEIETILPQINDNARALSYLSVVYLYLVEYDIALRLAQRAYQLNPYSPTTLMVLSHLYYEQGKYRKAFDILENNGKSYLSSVVLALMHILDRNVVGLDENFRRAKQFVKADHPVIITLQSWLLLFNGNEKAARTMGDKLVEQIEEVPISFGWVLSNEVNRARFRELAEQQRHPILIYKLLIWKATNGSPDFVLAPYFTKIKLDQLPDKERELGYFRNKDEQNEVLKNEISLTLAQLEDYVGTYRNGVARLEVIIKDNRLYYSRTYSSGLLSMTKENYFVSVTDKTAEFEFFKNNTGELDLCVLRVGDSIWYFYKSNEDL
ncbi:winged helix-turn-helix domain-containing protein [Colwelliaceae bacterium BS250]